MSDCALDEMSPFEQMILLYVSADYSWSDAGIVRIGESGDLAACVVGDLSGLSGSLRSAGELSERGCLSIGSFVARGASDAPD